MPTLADVARMRLLSHALLRRLDSAGAVVRHLTCVQAQDFNGSTLSIALRSQERSLSEVHAAYDAADLVRSWVMRGTLFVVAAEDLGWMLGLTSDKVIRQSARRRDALGLDASTLAGVEAVAREVLDGSRLTRSELLDAWSRSGYSVDDGRGYHLLFNLAVRGIICQGPMTDGQQQYVLYDQWVTAPRQLDRDEAIEEWFARYVRSHGPVPAADFLWWTKLTKRDLAPALTRLRDTLDVFRVDDVDYWVDPHVSAAYESDKRLTAATLLLPGFDELVLGYGDRRAVLSREHEALVVPGGNGMFKSTVSKAGRGLGTWRRPRRGTPVVVEPFGPGLPANVERAVAKLDQEMPR